MKIIYTNNYEEMSKIAGELVVDEINSKRDCILGLATGSTPLGLYKYLIEQYEKGLDFSNISTFNLDEYIGLSKDNSQSYYYFMFDNLFNHINIPIDNINIPNGVNNPEQEIMEYESKLKAAGGVDLQILGLGGNGHIAFNEPAKELNTNTSIIELSKSTIQANSRFFDRESDVPTKAISMGIGSIFSAKKIILLISGIGKDEATNYLLKSGKISTEYPASLLNLHQDVVVIIDKNSMTDK